MHYWNAVLLRSRRWWVSPVIGLVFACLVTMAQATAADCEIKNLGRTEWIVSSLAFVIMTGLVFCYGTKTADELEGMDDDGEEN